MTAQVFFFNVFFRKRPAPQCHWAVVSSSYFKFIFITLLIRHLLTDRMRHSNSSPRYGARERLYLRFIPCFALNCFNAFLLNVFPLSVTINFGIPRHAINLLWLCKYAAVDLLLLLWMLALLLLWILAGHSLHVMDPVILLIFCTMHICWEFS